MALWKEERKITVGNLNDVKTKNTNKIFFKKKSLMIL